MTNICKIALIMAIFMLFVGCQSMYLPSQKHQEQSDSKYYTHEVAQTEMPDVVVTDKEPGTTQQAEKADIFGQSYQDDSGERKVMQGWRVQLFTTKDKAEADSLVSLYSSELDMKVYRPYESPYFKLKVGDCQSEQEAKELLEEVKKVDGLQDAWIVRDQVNNNQQ